MTPARYLIQTRYPGEAWRSFASCHALEQAKALADSLADQVSPDWPAHHAALPLHAYVRVTRNGASVYDPRAKKARTA